MIEKYIAILQRILCSYYIVDPDIALQCSAKQRRIYAFLGAIIGFFFFNAVISSFYAALLIFDYPIFSFIFALFWALTVFNIYRFTLVNISGSFLNDENKKSTLFKLSGIMCFVYIFFIVLTISKPIELFIFNDKIDGYVDNYKKTKYDNFELELNRLVDNKQIAKEKKGIYLREFQNCNLKSKYFIQRLKMLNYYFPLSWLITLFLLVLFIYPSYRKFKFADTDEYEKINSVRETNLIVEEYKFFKKWYEYRFFINTNKEIVFHEWAIDPPFNTTKIRDYRTFTKHQELIDFLKNQETQNKSE